MVLLLLSVGMVLTVGCGSGLSTSAFSAPSANLLTIQGPSIVEAGTAAQFSLANPPSATATVSWSSNDSEGHNVGSISDNGMYLAPASLPANPIIKVSASVSGYQSGSRQVTLANPTVSATAKIYYVDSTNGNDSNSGTSESSAWQTIGKVNHSVFSPGDTILLRRGDIWRETLVVPSSGTASNVITFGAYSTGNAPVIDVASAVSGWTAEDEGGFSAYYVSLPSQPYLITMDGAFVWASVALNDDLNWDQLPLGQMTPGHFLWDSSKGRAYIRLPNDQDPKTHVIELGQTPFAILIDAKSYIRIQDLSVSGGNYNCVRAVDQSDYLQIVDNTITNCGFAGNQGAIFIDGAQSTLIQGNTISYGGNIGVNVSGYDGGNSDNTSITNNIIHNMGYDCIQYGPVLTGSVANGLAEHNDISYCGQNRQDSAGIDAFLPGTGLVFRNNYVHSGGTTATFSTGIRFDSGSSNEAAYGNVVYLNSSGCVQLTGSKNAAYNNTCYHNNELVAFDFGELNIFVSSIGGAPSGLRFYNNIVVPSNNKHAVVINDGATASQAIDRNLYSVDATVSEFSWGGIDLGYFRWQFVSGQDATSPAPSAAGFQSQQSQDFTLVSTSPAIGIGISLSGYVYDIAGDVVRQASPDLGAYQYVGGRPAASTPSDGH